jgi:xylulokinase
MFGSGLREPGTLQLTMGSGGQIVSAVDQAVRSGQGTTLFRTAARHGWYVMAATSNAGLALDWVRTVLAASWDELYAAAAGPGRESDPLFLPHLTGERTPWLDSTMRGAWVGLALAHDRTALLRGALEGVAFAVRTAMDEVGGPASPSAVRIAGGGTTHPAWRQLLADVLGRPLDAVDVTAASGRGAALLGGCAADLVDEGSVFGRLAPSTRRVSDPRPDRSRLAAARHELWLKHVSASRQMVSDTTP